MIVTLTIEPKRNALATIWHAPKPRDGAVSCSNPKAATKPLSPGHKLERSRILKDYSDHEPRPT
jgi:hypothetical protein